ncbi:TniQ family protein [Bacillus thuringiensis]|uniref:TniQ family protein n=1 Tax=Bacillus thuringiensis TaxID=1428 RepID=UPI003977C04D
MKSFLNKVLIQKNESLYSFLYRNIKVNYHDDLESVVQGGRFTFNNYLDETSRGFQEINKLARQGVNKNPFSLSLNQFDKILFNEKIPNKNKRSMVYDLKKTKFCPQCLVENFYHRLFWDISLITICTVHKKMLIDKCDMCGRSIRLSWLMRNRCLCSNAYTHIQTKPTSIEEHLESQEAIQRFLLESQHVVKIEKNGRLNAKEFFSLYFLFCRLIQKVSTKNLLFEKWNLKTDKIFLDGKNGGYNDLETMTIIVTVLYQLIVYPFQKLSMLIDGIDDVQNSKNTEAVSARRYNILKDIILHPRGGYYYDAYSKYVRELNNGYTNDKMIIKHGPFKNQYAPVNETMKVTATIKSKREVMLGDKVSVEVNKEMQNEIWTIIDVCEYLGIDYHIAQQLIDYELIIPSKESSIDGSFKKRFNKKKVEGFLSSLLKSLIILQPSNDEWIPISKVMYLLRKRYGAILLEVKQGRLQAAISEDKMNLSGLYISKSDVEQYNKINKQLRIKQLGYVLGEVQKIFRCGMPKIKKMIDVGTFTVIQVTNNNGIIITYFSKESIEEYLMKLKGWSHEEMDKYIEQKIFL